MKKIKVIKLSKEEQKCKENVSRIIKVPIDEIKRDTLKYYYMKPGWCCKEQLQPLFGKIARYNIYGPVEKYCKYYSASESNYFKLLKKNAEKYKPLFDEKKVIRKNSAALDNIFELYCQSRSTNRLCYIFPNDIKNNTLLNICKELDDTLYLFYIKKMELKLSAVKSMLYQLYSIVDTPNIINHVNSISNKLGWDATKNDEYLTTYVILCEPKDKTFTGITDFINEKYITTITFTQTVEQSKIVFNNTSIDFINNQKYDQFLKFYKTPSTFMFNTLKNWLYTNIKPIDQNRFLLYSSIVLYAYGFRLANDIDGLIKEVPAKASTTSFISKVDAAFISDKSKFPFTDILLKKYNDTIWPEWWEKHIKGVSVLLGAKTIDDLVANPKYYFSFMGIKMLKLEGDIIKRQHRCKPRSYADLIALKIMYNPAIVIPKIPTVSPDRDRKVDKNKFIETIKWCLNKRYNIQLTTDEINSYIET